MSSVRPIPLQRFLPSIVQKPSNFAIFYSAIDKPQSLSSAQVLRDLQTHFAQSKIFAPLLEEVRAKQAHQDLHSRKRRRTDDDNVFKMGHGGTLDPLATGVLIVGLARGTKHLNDFLGCTKTYETVVLFGKSTDTYDIAGKVVAEAPYEHVTRILVEEKLARFRGRIKQVPPIYSALRINGKKAYEYARTGKELPKELESRDMEVTECEMVDWYEGGRHEFRWPCEEATAEDRLAAAKFIKAADNTKHSSHDNTQTLEQATPTELQKSPGVSSPQPSTVSEISPSIPDPSAAESSESATQTKAALHTHSIGPLSDTPSPAPAARIRLTVSSGFYVRSFAHDLGVACNSLAIMASLVRSRQGQFYVSAAAVDDPVPLPAPIPTTTDPPGPKDVQTSTDLIPALPYTDLALGESIWGPKLQSVLTRWMERHPAPAAATTSQRPRFDHRDRRWREGRSDRSNQDPPGRKRDRRRNSSSPDD